MKSHDEQLVVGQVESIQVSSFLIQYLDLLQQWLLLGLLNQYFDSLWNVLVSADARRVAGKGQEVLSY